MRKATRSILKQYLLTLTLTILAALAFRNFVLEPYRIPSSRLQSELQPGDYVLVWKPGYSWGGTDPQPGEVLLFRSSDSTFKVKVMKLESIEPDGRLKMKQDAGFPTEELVNRDAVLGKAWLIWLSIEPLREDQKNWLSRLRLDRVFKKVGS